MNGGTDSKRGLGRVFRPTYKDRSTGERKEIPTWWVQFSVNGRCIRKSSGSDNRASAIRFLKAQISEATQGKNVAPEVDRTTFEDLAKILVNDYKANGRRSIESVERALKHLRAHFGFDKARVITSDRIVSYITKRQEEAAKASTINRELAALRHSFNLAMDAGRVANKPKVRLLAENNVRRGFIEPPQLQALIDESPEYLRALYETAFTTGWRVISELLPLTWDRVDFESGWVRLDVGTTKNGRGREFPLIGGLREVLPAQYERAQSIEKETGRPVERVFFHPNGSEIRDFRKAFNNACDRAGLKGLIPHDFRRCAARGLLRAGVSQPVAMKLLGHETAEIFRRYSIVDSGMLAEAGKKLAAFHAGQDRTRPMTPGEVERLADRANKQSSIKAAALSAA
ncbi:MAG TPA: site-specific integrase [Candidatus Binataceae bacterium]|nr:site-specific integrase [Candidatus Binataceae bacterium]